jgi:UDP-glucose 4-epimerase
MAVSHYNIEVQKLLLTGSEGFIGKKLRLKLRELGYLVSTVDKISDTSGFPDVHFTLDLADPNLKLKLGGLTFDVIIHTAAQTSVPFSMTNIEEDASANIISTINLLELASVCSCSNFIYAQSGGAIYSPESILPINENSITKPSSPYGLSKLVGEKYVSLMCHINGIQWTSLAFSNIYGSVAENPKGVIFEFWKRLSQNIPADVYGVNNTRDFLHIDDAIAAFIYAIDNPLNRRVNISSSIETSLGKVFDLVAKEMGKEQITPNFYSHREGEVFRSALDNRLAKDLLKWEPLIDLETGVRNSLGEINW